MFHTESLRIRLNSSIENFHKPLDCKFYHIELNKTAHEPSFVYYFIQVRETFV